MAGTTTLTIRLPVETKDRLEMLAAQTNRKQSFLGAEAIADYVARELAIVRALEEGLDDLDAGRVVSHEDVMAEIDDILGTVDQNA